MGLMSFLIVFRKRSQPSRIGASSFSEDTPGGVNEICSPRVASKTQGNFARDSYMTWTSAVSKGGLGSVGANSFHMFVPSLKWVL
jgi:hypothetical protein